MVAKEEGAGGGMAWEVGVSRCKLLYTEWIENKILLHSTEHCIQYPMINHRVRYFFKCTSMYNRITLLYRSNQHSIVSQPCFNYKKEIIVQEKGWECLCQTDEIKIESAKQDEEHCGST